MLIGHLLRTRWLMNSDDYVLPFGVVAFKGKVSTISWIPGYLVSASFHYFGGKLRSNNN
jgi:hypothetical protein